jgi:nicotinamidase-related amidase
MSEILVVIDMQNGFMDEKALFIVPVIKKLHEFFNRNDKPVIFTKFINPRQNSPYRRLLGWHKLSDVPEIDIIPELNCSKKIIINKYTNTSFTDDFEKVLDDYSVDRLYLCGMSTESCILKTALDAFEKNITPIVLADACFSTAGMKAHEAGMQVIKNNIGDQQIMDSRSVIENLASGFSLNN